MAEQYSTKRFFRQMPNYVLARYFNEHGLFNDIDFSVMKEGKPDKLFKAQIAWHFMRGCAGMMSSMGCKC